ncbi:MAG: glutaredoxin 3 [Pelagibacterales bacterium]|nr:glutaredoxin 3 [Pelagibacterales bacterium]|tara:strand:- start:11772 stop:12038 length:267 start_codon:yes stop_codon:yes gene_type:complete
MSGVVIYTGHLCGYCSQAKKLLKSKNIDFEEINIHDQYDKKEEMIKLSGGRVSVPQIFSYGKHIGGCDDLFDMESAGELDKALNIEID